MEIGNFPFCPQVNRFIEGISRVDRENQGEGN
jgi:hypothetical protein